MKLFAGFDRTSYTALDVLCAEETMMEILGAMTWEQREVAAALYYGMTTTRIADALNITPSAVSMRRKQAQDRVARTMPHVNAEHLLGDVMARTWQRQKEQRRDEWAGTCSVCGRDVYYRSTRCRQCAQRERREREREETA